MRYIIEVAGKEIEVELFEEGGTSWAKIHNKKIRAELMEVPQSKLYRVFLGDRIRDLYLSGSEGAYTIQLAGRYYELKVSKALMRAFQHMSKPKSDETHKEALAAIVANMPGLVVKIAVTEGQEIHEGDGLMVLDAMKMENEIRSPYNGIVKEVSVTEGQEVEKGQLLCRILVSPHPSTPLPPRGEGSGVRANEVKDEGAERAL